MDPIASMDVSTELPASVEGSRPADAKSSRTVYAECGEAGSDAPLASGTKVDATGDRLAADVFEGPAAVEGADRPYETWARRLFEPATLRGLTREELYARVQDGAINDSQAQVCFVAHLYATLMEREAASAENALMAKKPRHGRPRGVRP